MVAILRFFAVYAPLIYLAGVIGILFAVRGLVRSLHEMRESVFGLERELAQRHLSQSIAALVLIGMILFGEIVLQVILAPNLPALSLLATPTINPLAVPTSTLSPELAATLGITPAAFATVTASGCIPGQIMLTSPQAGEEISGQITLTGTANVPDFGFYKYEFSVVGTDIWSTIQAGRTVVDNGELGLWDTSQITPGDYLLRLVVMDNEGNPLPACVVPVRVLAK